MGDPFARCALVEPTVVAAIPVDHPDAIREGAGIEKPIGVIRAELKMSNGVAAQDDFALAGDGIDNCETGILADIELDRPIAIIMAERGRTHRRCDHALFTQGDYTTGCRCQFGKVHQLFFGQRGKVNASATHARRKIDITAIARRVDRPVA